VALKVLIVIGLVILVVNILVVLMVGLVVLVDWYRDRKRAG